MTIWKPSVTVAAVIERQGRFLLVQERSEGRLVLNQPAGHLDPGESLVEACRREAMEETAHVFEPALAGTERRPLDKEIVALHWLSAEELAHRQAEHRSPLVQKCVEDFRAGRRYPLDVISSEFQ